eukprot:CAMPEP_0197667678 /NCGR_PEP_ID=MMETSP1338-20131121/67120_1 /TAXON_ID=43686 ORGANISM="Pelagodinium beii, Strain RCC1491" /NCGR_SAMPLE_ID=MMETSP1338 /ASSEMBLY_ACC=CAM_ASM_000754 /LENGTH=356 /DNA_ID=CAMNT_0043246971 /DNA_START=9 /DNA_END=1076 /DNA_ORIENTATION=-
MYHSPHAPFQFTEQAVWDSNEPQFGRGQPYASFTKFQASAVGGEENEYHKVDSETTEAGASDRLSQLSSGYSDEEPHGGPRGASFRTKASPKPPARPSLDDALSSGTRDFFEWQDEQPEEEKNLVDLEPEEGRRRGGELMTLLFDSPLQKPKASQPLPGSQPAPARALAGQKAAQPQQLMQRENAVCNERHLTGSVTEAYVAGQWDAPLAHEVAHDHNSYHSRITAELVPALYEASHVAFGPGQTANVAFLPDGTGYEVWVQGFPAQELERGNGEAVLDELSNALWPTLGNEFLGMVKRQEQQFQAQQMPCHRLTLWRSCEEETAAQRAAGTLSGLALVLVEIVVDGYMKFLKRFL